MPDVSPTLNAYRFGPFRLSVSDRLLERDGERIQLTPKVTDTLFVLVENAGQLVTKEALMKAVWPDVTVVESGLTRNLSALRKALEESQEGSYIETIPRRGYRFVAEVSEEFRPAVPELPEAQPVPEPNEVKTKKRPWIWIGTGITAIAALAVWLLLSYGPRNRRMNTEPSVRIGEHLLYKLAPEETIRAAEHFEHAIQANPQSAGAHAGLSIALLHLAMLGVRSLPEVLPQAEPAARKALQLDPDSSSAHYAIACIHMIKYWDYKRADSEFQQALKRSPESVQFRHGYAELKLATGDFKGALRLVEEALQLDPASPPLGASYCRVFYYLRDFRRAESECRRVLDREPGYALAHYYLALSLGWLGRFQEASQSLNRTGLMPGVLEVDQAWLSLRQGDRRPALAALETRRELVRRGKVGASAKILLTAILDQADEAFETLDEALKARAPEMLGLAIDPRLDSLRSDPRYSSVIRRIVPADR